MNICRLDDLLSFGKLVTINDLDFVKDIRIDLVVDLSTRKEREQFGSKYITENCRLLNDVDFKFCNFPINKNFVRSNLDIILLVREISVWLFNGKHVYICCPDGKNRSALIAGLVLTLNLGFQFEDVIYNLRNFCDGCLTKQHFLDQLENLSSITYCNDKMFKISYDLDTSVSEDENAVLVFKKILKSVFERDQKESLKILEKIFRLGLHLIKVGDDMILSKAWNTARIHFNAWIYGGHPEYSKPYQTEEQKFTA